MCTATDQGAVNLASRKTPPASLRDRKTSDRASVISFVSHSGRREISHPDELGRVYLIGHDKLLNTLPQSRLDARGGSRASRRKVCQELHYARIRAIDIRVTDGPSLTGGTRAGINSGRMVISFGQMVLYSH